MIFKIQVFYWRKPSSYFQFYLINVKATVTVYVVYLKTWTLQIKDFSRKCFSYIFIMRSKNRISNFLWTILVASRLQQHKSAACFSLMKHKTWVQMDIKHVCNSLLRINAESVCTIMTFPMAKRVVEFSRGGGGGQNWKDFCLKINIL